MIALLLALACAGEPGPAAEGSRSAALAVRAGDVGRRATALSARARDLEGLYDELRAAPEDARPALRARIHARALELREEALALQEDVERIETAALVY